MSLSLGAAGQNDIFSQSSRCGHDNFTRKAEAGGQDGSGVRYRFEIVVEARSEIRTNSGGIFSCQGAEWNLQGGTWETLDHSEDLRGLVCQSV